MQPGISIGVKKNDFEKIARGMPAKTSAVVRKTAFDILALSIPRTPVDTGFLRNSASVSATDTEAAIHWAAHYAAFQEFGTRYIAPRLFATSAAEAVRPGYVQAMKQMLSALGG